MIGVNEKSIEFCPDNQPALFKETISWIWTYRPDLGTEILKQNLPEDFIKLVSLYRDNEMDKFWSYITE